MQLERKVSVEKVLVSLTAPQLSWLRQRAAELNISRSELVRRIVDEARIKQTKEKRP